MSIDSCFVSFKQLKFWVLISLICVVCSQLGKLLEGEKGKDRGLEAEVRRERRETMRGRLVPFLINFLKSES